ncbi:MAG: flagellar protein FlgN [Thermodesulfobacteriota bacterium]
MKPLEEIKKVLGEQIEGCRRLLELLQQEKFCLMDLQMEGVESIVKAKDILVLKLRLLEEERIRLVDRFITEHPECLLGQEKDFQKINLQKLAELTGEIVLVDMRSQLISLSQSIREMNEFNKAMIDRTLVFLRKNSHFLEIRTTASGTTEKGRLLSRAT